MFNHNTCDNVDFILVLGKKVSNVNSFVKYVKFNIYLLKSIFKNCNFIKNHNRLFYIIEVIKFII